MLVRRVPTIDTFGDPGIQTALIASSSGTSNLNPPPAPNGTSFSAGTGRTTVEPAAPTLSTKVVDEEVALGEPVSDAATLTGGAAPTGTMTFDLYGPNDEDCSGEPVHTTTHPVDGSGTYASAPATPEAAGAYRYIARYSGDHDNAAISGSCNDPNESVVVTAAEPPGLRVDKEATPLTRPEPGGTFAFAVDVTNTSAIPLTLTGLQDDVYGDVSGQGTCTSAIGTVLAPGDTYGCAFSGEVEGNAGTTQTDTVTATAADGTGAAVSDEDEATVSLTDVPPTITVAKTALPEERVAPGGAFTYQVVVTNTSFEPITITGLEDDVEGDLTELTGSSCAAAVGASIAPGAELSCTFSGELTGPPGTAQTDVVTVTVADDDGSTGTAHDDATVRLVAPGVTTTTVPSPPTSSRPSPTTRPSPSPTVGGPGLARTGGSFGTRTALALALLGAGVLLTGISWTLPGQRGRSRTTPL
jgi:hypothetical protein